MMIMSIDVRDDVNRLDDDDDEEKKYIFCKNRKSKKKFSSYKKNTSTLKYIYRKG